MLKSILGVFLAAFAFTASAQTLDISKLPVEQQKQLVQQYQQMTNPTQAATNMSATVRKEAEAWGELGANAGRAVVSAAKEVGMAANEFSQTPLGKIVMIIVAYKIVGHDVLGILFGSLTLVIGTVIAIWLVARPYYESAQYDYKPFLFGMWQRKVLIKMTMDSDVQWGKWIAGGFVLVLTWVVGLNTIF